MVVAVLTLQNGLAASECTVWSNTGYTIFSSTSQSMLLLINLLAFLLMFHATTLNHSIFWKTAIFSSVVAPKMLVWYHKLRHNMVAMKVTNIVLLRSWICTSFKGLQCRWEGPQCPVQVSHLRCISCCMLCKACILTVSVSIRCAIIHFHCASHRMSSKRL